MSERARSQQSRSNLEKRLCLDSAIQVAEGPKRDAIRVDKRDGPDTS